MKTAPAPAKSEKIWNLGELHQCDNFTQRTRPSRSTAETPTTASKHPEATLKSRNAEISHEATLKSRNTEISHEATLKSRNTEISHLTSPPSIGRNVEMETTPPNNAKPTTKDSRYIDSYLRDSQSVDSLPVNAPFVDILLEDSTEQLNILSNHNFAQDLGTGELPRRKFGYYLAQDIRMLDHFARLLGRTIDQSKAVDPQISGYTRFLSALVDPERDFFSKASQDGFLDKQANSVTTGAWLKKVANAMQTAKDYHSCLATVFGCVWGISEWISPIARPNSSRPAVYTEWIEAHSNSSFKNFLLFLTSEMNAIPNMHREKVRKVFQSMLCLEEELLNESYAAN